MFAQERHHTIKKLVQAQRRLSFAELQSKISVSPATLRRDLSELEALGEVLRVHGGVMDPSYARSEISFDERLLRNKSAKKAIAQKAASLIPAGASVFIDAGSTCLEAGKALLGRKDIRIITHSVSLIAECLRAEAEVLCIGGEVRKVSGALTGASALGVLAKIFVDCAFLGATGLDSEGCSTTELFEAEIKQAIIARSKKRILLADSSKWQNTSVIRFAEWSQITDWVCEKSLKGMELKNLPMSKIKIIIA